MVREERTVEVTLISATDLKKVKMFGMDQNNYVSAYIYPSQRQITAADRYGGVNPMWITTLKLRCYESDLFPADTSSGAPAVSSSSAHKLTLEIYSHSGGIFRGIFHAGDKLVGTVTVPLQQVASAAKAEEAMLPFDVHLPTGSGEVHGTLNLSVKLGAKRELEDHEDMDAAPLSSYSDQVAPSLFYPPERGDIPSTQPRINKSEGQSSHDNYPSSSGYTPSAQHQKSSVAAAEEHDFVTGYPAPRSSYPFAPLGQLPRDREYQSGPETSAAYGPYVLRSPDEGSLFLRRRERKHVQQAKKWERQSERKMGKRERRSEERKERTKRWAGMGKKTVIMHVAMAVLKVLTLGLL